MSISTRIEAMYDHVGDIYDTLELGGEDLTNVDKNIVNIDSSLKNRYKDYLANGTDRLWNNWEKVSESGETLTLTPTIKGKMKVDLKGNTYQYSTNGDNLLPQDKYVASTTINGITYTNNGDGTFSLSGTASANTTFVIIPYDEINLEANQPYYLYSSQAYNVTTFNLSIPMTDDSTTKFILANNTYTPTTTPTNVRLQFYLASGNSVNAQNVKLMLVKGTTAPTKYEEYTGGIASPNPDYPQQIHVVSGDNSINVCGKNRLTTLNATSTNKQTTILVSNGIIHDTTSKTGNTEYADVFSFTNVISYGNYGGYVIPQGNIIELEAGTYTFSYHKISGTAPTYNDASKSRNINVYKYGSSTPYTNLGGARIIGDNASVTFTLTEKSRVSLTYGYYFFGDISTDVYFTLQLEKGSTATPYEPYQSASYPISLGVENLYNLPNEETLNGITYTKNANGTINLIGTATANTPFMVYKDLATTNIINGKAYTLSATQSLPSGVEIRLEAYNGTTWLRHVLNSTLNSTQQKITNNANTTNATRVRYLIYVASGTSVNITNLEIQLGIGTNKVSSTPIELCKIGDYQDSIKKSTGKNLFDISTITENTYIEENGNTGSSQVTNLSNYIEVKPNTSYKLSYNYSTLLNSNQRNVIYYDENKTYISGWIYLPINKTTTITTPNNAKYIRFSYDKNCYSIMLNEGTTALPYEPYGTSWYLNKQIGKVVLDGTTNPLYGDGGSSTDYWEYSRTGITGGIGIQASVLTTYFNQTTNSRVVILPNGGLYLRFSKNAGIDVSTNTLLNTWLSNHNTSVYYVLGTPTYEEITDTTLLSQLNNLYNANSYEETTNVSQTNDDMPFILDLTCLKEIS